VHWYRVWVSYATNPWQSTMTMMSRRKSFLQKQQRCYYTKQSHALTGSNPNALILFLFLTTNSSMLPVVSGLN